MSKLTDYQEAALAYDKHISLTANAGSGKTTVLSKRFVEILINESISINNIVAITFTEKAASELYSKIAKELDAKILTSGLKIRRKLEYLRRSLVSAKISTIHSFCIDILKDFAPEAGIDANFSPIDARTSDELLEQSIDEVLRSLLISDSKSVKTLIRILGNKNLLVKQIKHLFSKRKTTEKLISSIYQKDVNHISNWYSEKFEEEFIELFEGKFNSLIENLTLLNKLAGEYKLSERKIEVDRILNEIDEKDFLIERIKYLSDIKSSILTQKNEIVKRGYLSKVQQEENEELVQQTNKFFDELKDFHLSGNFKLFDGHLAAFGKILTDLYIQIREKYTSKKQQKSYLDFEDLLLLAQELLKNEQVKKTLSQKFKYIMIDEYQDTNETQYNIFMPILDNLALGNLFIVGDEKQSIYMFREAEVELFNKTKTEIESNSNDASLLKLPHSFRLTPNIAQFTNELFRQLFSNPVSKFNEVCHNDIACAYPGTESGKVEFLVSDAEEISEAELITRKIFQLTNDKYNYSDITILCTKRKNFSELENTFIENGIPFSIVGGKGYYQQQLILDVYSYLSFLLNPKNDLALASLLRAPYFNLSDIELTQLSQLDAECLFDKLQINEKYKEIKETLETHLNLSHIFTPSELIRKINVDTGYWSYLASKPEREQEIANLEKLIKKSASFNEQGFHTLFDFTNYLKDAINNLEDEGQADLEIGGNSVQIMTIHQSKGLEFKIVIIFKTNQKSFDESIKSKEIIIDKNYGILSKLPDGDKYFEEYKAAPIVGLYNYVQKRKSIAEDKRLLYVAITRAEEHLIISWNTKNEKVWPNSFASIILNAFKLEGHENEFELSSRLDTLKYDGEVYSSNESVQKQTIEITNYIDKIENENSAIDERINKYSEINISRIKSSEKNEIISASKISLFLNCPKKYELTYEFGYGELTKLFKSENDFEFSVKEYENIIPSNIIGSVSHAVLEQNISEHEIEQYVNEIFNKEGEVVSYSDEQKNNSISELIALLKKFYSSPSYKRLNSYNDFHNEAEFYLREHDYYLYGIIDKLIIDKDKIIIVDYKSDKVNKLNQAEKSETYQNQLMFYAYILLNKYPHTQNFELDLIFLRDDEYSCIKSVSRNEVERFGKTIYNSVQKIRSKEFNDDYDGCKNMKYYLLEEN